MNLVSTYGTALVNCLLSVHFFRALRRTSPPLRRRRQLHHRHIRRARRKKPDEPRVVVEEMQRLDEHADQRDPHPKHQRNHRPRIHALGVVVHALAMIERVHIQLRPANEEVIAHHDPGHRPQQPRVAHQPAEDVRVRRGQQLPRAHRQPQKSGNQPARAKADQPRIQI